MTEEELSLRKVLIGFYVFASGFRKYDTTNLEKVRRMMSHVSSRCLLSVVSTAIYMSTGIMNSIAFSFELVMPL